MCAIKESKDLTMLLVEHEQWRKVMFEPLNQVLQAKLDLNEGAWNTQGWCGLGGSGHGRGGCGQSDDESYYEDDKEHIGQEN